MKKNLSTEERLLVAIFGSEAFPKNPDPPKSGESGKAASATIEEMLRTLTPREAKVIRLRFGLTDDGTERTLEEVGSYFNVPRERIRQIQALAMRKLRNPNRLRQLKAYTELL